VKTRQRDAVDAELGGTSGYSNPHRRVPK
jgi:hypothetical protein